MDFEAVLREVGATLERRGRRWAVIGGVAMAAYGRARGTLDLDLVTESEGQAQIIEDMERAGYRTLSRSPGFSNHEHADPARGRVCCDGPRPAVGSGPEEGGLCRLPASVASAGR